MRRALVAVVVTSWVAVSQAGIVGDFGDIRFWAGSGTNQAAFVLDFGTAAPQAAPAAVAWGYRWNGTANLDDMIFALTGSISGSAVPAPAPGSDPRLAIDATYYESFASYFIRSISYDQVGLPAGWSQVTRTLENDFDNDLGIAQYEATAAQAAWPTGGDFTVSPLGPADTLLVSGGWYGYVVSPYDPTTFSYPSSFAFSQPTAAVPEPGTLALAAAGVALVGLGLRRRVARATLGRAASRPRRPRSQS